MPFFDVQPAFDLYSYVIYHVVPGPNNASYVISLLLLPISLLIHPSSLSHRQLYTLFLPIIYALQIYSWSQMRGIDVISFNLTLWSFILLVLKDPRRDFKRMHLRKRNSPKPEDKDETEDRESLETWEDPYPPTLSRRIPWVLTMMLSIRFTNWKINDPSHDKRQPSINRTSRRAFTLFALQQIITGYLLLDVATTYTHFDPYFHTSSIPISSPVPLPLLHYLPPRLIRSYALAAQIYALIPCLFHLPVLPVIGLNYLFPALLPDTWSPHTWASFFGPFSAVLDHGLRGLWSEWWHQMSRHVVSTPGRALADVFGLGKGWVRWWFVTVSAFGFSGVMHMGLIPPEPLNTAMTAMEMRLWVGTFFWVQIVGFAAELFVVKTYFRLGGRVTRFTRVIVLLWVVAWLSLALPLIVPPFRELGYWRVRPVPVSIVQGLLGNAWLQWR